MRVKVGNQTSEDREQIEFDTDGSVAIGLTDNPAGNVVLSLANSGSIPALDSPLSAYISDPNLDQVVEFEVTEVPSASITTSGRKYFVGDAHWLSDGSIRMFFRDGPGSGVEDGVGVISSCLSTDGGSSFSAPAALFDESGQSINLADPAGLVTKKNEVIFYSRYDGNSDFGNCLGIGYQYRPLGSTQWSGYIALKTFSPEINVGAAYGPGIYLGGGVYLKALYFDNAGTWQVECWKSTDYGVTWTKAGNITSTSDGTKNANETTICALGGKYVLAVTRDEKTGTYTCYRQFLSSDGGVTWTDQGVTTFDTWSTPSPAVLKTFRGPRGKLLVGLFYGNRTAGALRVIYASAANLIANGVTAWKTNTRRDLYTSMPSGGGYPMPILSKGYPTGIVPYFDGNGVVVFHGSPVQNGVLNGLSGYGIRPFYVGNPDNYGDAVWAATANDVILHPFTLDGSATLSSVIVHIGTSSANLCVGIYDENGNRLATSGSTASPGTGARTIAFSSAVSLDPGRYYLAVQVDNGTIRLHAMGTNNLGMKIQRLVQPGAFPLPTSLTPGSTVAPVYVSLVAETT